jgi:hypothetical protein
MSSSHEDPVYHAQLSEAEERFERWRKRLGWYLAPVVLVQDVPAPPLPADAGGGAIAQALADGLAPPTVLDPTDDVGPLVW